MRLKTLAFITVLAVGMSARATNVPRIILDSDVSGDYDDIGAMATLFNLEAEGKCRVLGIASSSAYPWSVPLVETIARSFGRGDLPIARSVPGAPEAKNWEKVQFAQVVSARFAHPRFAETKDAAEPVRFYRDLLSAQPDGSVTLCVVGWASNVAALLESEGGRELVARKVAKLVWMAGREKGGLECNFMMDVKASKRVLADFPRPIVLSTFEIGSHVFTGCRLVKELGVDDPVRLCYSTVFAQSPAAAKRGRESWDQTAVWYAVHGDDDLFRAVRGTIAATDDEGTNSWTDDPNGPHARLEFVAAPEQVAARIEDYMVRRPVRIPSLDTRPYVWWHWTGTAVTKVGIIRDLDAMLDAGIGGATIFQVARGPCSEVLAEGYEDDTNPGLVFGNDAWCDMVAFAAAEAKKRGLEIGMHNCPGYTVSGGPWITPETAMKKLVWTSAPKGTEPSQPETNLGFYREIGTVDVGDRTYRFGYTCTGSQCMPVAKALWNRCLEADKMSAKAVNLHLDNVLRRPLGLDFILMDSYEAGPYDWTDDFRAEFEKRRGYDPLPRLPAYVGAVSDGAEKIKADMARTVKELSTERHYWIFRDRLHAAGLKFIVEPYGGPFDASEAAWASDMPTTEFWGRRPFWVKEGEIGAHPQVGGAAGRAAGRTILAAEAFTAMPFDDSYTVAPRDLKACADASFARGINRMLLHHWVHQPFPACRKPGNGMGYWGTHFGENQTWYEPGKAFFRYLRNCQEWLQRGEQVIDVLAVGEGFGNCDDVDVVPRRIYETDTETKDGRVRIVSSGRTYSQVCLNPQNLKIPRRPFEVVGGMPVTPDGPVLGTARVDKDGTRFFFVANVSTNHVVFMADFRATGVPELHDLEGGRTGRKDVLSVKDGYSRLRLSLEAQESVVVVFRPDSSLPPWEDRSVAGWTAQTLAAPWSVAFEPDRGAPTEPIELKELRSLSAHSDARVRFFSGTATYRTRFTAKASGTCEIDLGNVRDIARVRLNGKDLGVAWHFPFRVSADGALKAGENVLEVEVTNGWHNRLLGDKTFPDDCEWGPLRKHQCAMDGSKGVCGRGLKRIPDWAWEADGSRPSTNRVAFTTWDYFAEGGELVTSGLIGPVRILTPDVRTGKKVLMIGNSFSQSVLTRLPAVAAADGEDLDISNLMIGGCVLSRHASNIVAYAKDPTFKPYTWPRYRNGKFVGRTKTNIPEALAADKWDIVTIQQGSSACYQADSYHPWGDELVATIRKYAPQAKIMVQQTWSYNELNRCIHDPYTGGPGWFGIDRDTMYRNLTSNYYAFAEKYGFEVIPTGNAVELFRHRAQLKNPADDVVGVFPKPAKGWWDLIHLNADGCQLQAYVWFKALFGRDPRTLPDPKDDRDRLMREVANDVFSVPPLSIEPYPTSAADYDWKVLYSGSSEGLPHGGATPDAFRATVRVRAESGRAGLVCGTSSLTLAADGTVTAAWADKAGVAQKRTFANAVPKGGEAELRLVRVNGGTALWHFVLDGKILFGEDSAEEKPDADGRFARLGVIAEGGASVGPVTLELPIVK